MDVRINHYSGVLHTQNREYTFKIMNPNKKHERTRKQWLYFEVHK